VVREDRVVAAAQEDQAAVVDPVAVVVREDRVEAAATASAASTKHPSSMPKPVTFPARPVRCRMTGVAVTAAPATAAAEAVASMNVVSTRTPCTTQKPMIGTARKASSKMTDVAVTAALATAVVAEVVVALVEVEDQDRAPAVPYVHAALHPPAPPAVATAALIWAKTVTMAACARRAPVSSRPVTRMPIVLNLKESVSRAGAATDSPASAIGTASTSSSVSTTLSPILRAPTDASEARSLRRE